MAMTRERLEELKRRLDDRSLEPLKGDDVAELIAEVERLQARPCPNDTNGDGDCGRVCCPWCVEKDVRKTRQ